MVIDFEYNFKLLLIEQDETTFNEFYLQTVDVFYRYLKAHYVISPEDSQDIIADFYVKCWNGFTRYDSSQNFSGYVWSIFKNNLKDFFKKKGEASFSSLTKDSENPFEEGLESEENIMELMEMDFAFEKIQLAMQKLDEINKEIVFLRYIEEKSYAEISEILRISQESLRQKISRAIKQLKSLLEDEPS